MEPRRNPPFHAVDQSGLDAPGRPSRADCSIEVPVEGSAGGSGVPSFSFSSSSSSLEGASMNGDGGKRRRRRKRSAAKRGGAWTGMQEEESVQFERGVYERAETANQPRPAGGRGGAPAADPTSPPPSPQQSDCRHGNQVACHHLVEAVWVNKSAFDSAERLFMERARPPAAVQPTPSSLVIAPNRHAAPPPGARSTPDEGYLSLTPTPPHRQSINGLPGLPPELLTGVWVEKTRYDQAEAAYYRSQCCGLAAPSSTPSCSGKAPGSRAGVENGDPEAPRGVEIPRPPSTSTCDAFPAEAAEPDVPASHFLHPDSEGVWLDAPKFRTAEKRFYETQAAGVKTTVAGAKAVEVDQPAPSMPCKLDSTMTGMEFLAQEKIWFDKFRYDEAECRFYERMNGPTHPPQDAGANTILQDIARARENIQKSLAGMKTSLQPGKGRSRTPQNRRSQTGVPGGAGDQSELVTRMRSLELENQTLHRVVEDLRSALSKLESRVAVLEKRPAVSQTAATTATPACTKTAPVQQPKVPAPAEEDDDDDLDLFGSDEEDEEAERIREERLKAYAEKKAKKPAIIAKSSILLDVKPWDDETDMAKLEECVRSVQADGLLWGSSKLVPVGYGIKKLQIQCVVEDDKVGTDMLEEEITKFEEYVQSVDVAAFNKI